MENSKQIFEVALNLSKPWYVKEIKFTPAGKTFGQLDIYLDFTKGAKFKDETGVECPVHDTMERTWQHLSFFQHTCYLHVRMPRIKTTSGKVQMVEASWARPHSGFTLLFEAFVMMLIESEMPINKVASILNVYAPRIWTIFNYWIALAKKEDKITDIKKIGIDETSAKKGHSYVTLAVDLDKRRVIFACPGKDETTIENGSSK